MNKRLLIIGLVWPEPEATAAGSRILQLATYFVSNGYEVHFASAASKSNLSYDLSGIGISSLAILLNHPSFEDMLADLNPAMVLFDRFLTEEQFGWKVAEICPKALRILDTEDLHFLRKAREMAIKNKSDAWKQFIQNDISKREIASIYRCDLSLIISEFEVSLLQQDFHVPKSLLLYVPFLIEASESFEHEGRPQFDERAHFMTIGNLKHQPNVDAVQYLYKDIWPLIRRELPQAALYIYGAYPPESIKQLHNPKVGFFIEGWIKDKKEAFEQARICLAPLRFGAGQKGKLIDAMVYGTPSITSSIGAEGMSVSGTWNGYIEDEPESFAQAAIKLYQQQDVWHRAQETGFSILKKQFNKSFFERQLNLTLEKLSNSLDLHRQSNFIGSMLLHHQHQSTKYLSKWIETKSLLDNDII